MIDELNRLFETHREPMYLLMSRLAARQKRFLLWGEVRDEVEAWEATAEGQAVCEAQSTQWLHRVQEAVVMTPLIDLAIRRGVADWTYIQVHLEEMRCREVDVSEYLAIKEGAIREGPYTPRYTLEVDLEPFGRGFPRMTETRSIGRGVEFLNRYLAASVFGRRMGEHGEARLLDFLRLHQARGQQLLLNGSIRDMPGLRAALREGAALMRADLADSTESERLHELRSLGFEPGWGGTPDRIAETMELLSDILEAPSPSNLERFLARIPMIYSIVIVSPHGYFGQSNVLGKPDTGGQVVYILDQVRALERAMRESIRDQGLSIEPQIVVLTRLIPDAGDTTCNMRIEPIIGTENSRILRVPFRDRKGEIMPAWISRFDVWPYLERFTVEAEREVLAEIGSRPDFIIGNYSDGNLVASLMAHRLGVTQCNIAHALEKTKYLLSDLHWKDHEEEHHFSCQFTADLIAMNTADFIITSTYQEIAGTEDSVGQYESYSAFTMPDLYRVVSGIDCFDTKFNIVSPGADPQVFFPYTREEHRLDELTEEIRTLVFGEPEAEHLGSFSDPEKPILFAMSRLDRIKNMPGLLEWYSRNDSLQDEANLLLVGGRLNPEQSDDGDERSQIELMRQLLDDERLDGKVRWIEMQTNKNRVGELYRVVADTRGAFVQPALFEAFGLTVVEAMSSGLPVFATQYGGPLETVADGVSGFHIDPARGDEATHTMVEFFRSVRREPDTWTKMSEAAVKRVEERYNWPLYASKLLKLSRIYGFWRYISNIEREETKRYLEMFYGLMYRRLARKMAAPDGD
ncbi:MAG: sucrose synthase [Gemmatimonadota bacterium]